MISALVAAHLIDEPAQAIAQCLDLFGRKTDVHEFVGNRIARLQIGAAARTVLGERACHFVIERANDGEALERLFLEPQQIGRLRRRRALLVLALVFLGRFLDDFLFFLGRFLDDLFFGIRIDEAVNDLISADFVFLDPVRKRENFGNGGRARRNRLDHVLEAALDAFRDLDFAFARQQFNRTHFAHVHAHRVGGTAKLGIDGG